MSIKGIDISSYQGTIDWAKVSKDGVKVAILRSVLKAGTTDIKFEANYKGAGNNGIARGVYIFSYALSVSAAKEEANKVVKLLNKRKLEYPVFYDLEWSDQRSKCSKSTLTQMVKEFEKIITKAGYKFGIYCNLDWYKNVLDTKTLKYDYWIARYPASDNGTVKSSLKPGVGEMGWQYSSKGKVSGISGHVDMNVFYKSYEASNTSSGSGSSTNTDSNKTDTNFGTKGTDSVIKGIQETLNKKYSCGLAADGIYGPKTKSGLVKALQTELNEQFGKGLAVDGIFGSKTKAACVNVRQGASGNITYILKSALYCSGVKVEVNDKYDEAAAEAVKVYQQQKSLSADGIAGRNTFEKLLK